MAQRPWRVAVTGIGLVTPLGLTATENKERVLRGECAASIAPAGSGAHAGAAWARVPTFDATPVLRNPKNLKLMSRSVQMALLATDEATRQSRVLGINLPPERIGVYVGSGQTGIEYDEFFKALTLAWENDRPLDYKFLGGMPTRMLDRYFSLRTLSNAGVSAISTEFGARGPSNNYVQGETAAAMAIYSASNDLLEDRCDAAIVCGFDSLLIPTNFSAFRNAGLLSGGGFSTKYTPFAKDRPGVVLGEGAGCLILERADAARERLAPVLGEVANVAMTSQFEDAASSDAELREAVVLAGVEPDWILARGLGTEAADRNEAEALKTVVPQGVPVTAIKGQTGYLGAATAAVELALGLLCAREGWAPPVGGYVEPDPAIDLPLVHAAPRRLPTPEPMGLFLSANFSGANAAIAARACGGASITKTESHA